MMEIKQKNIEQAITRTVKPAHWKEIDTGHKKSVTVIKNNGEVVEEERPVINKVFVDAIKEDVIEQRSVFAVHDGVDEHLFNTKEEAKRFLRNVNPGSN